MGTRYDPGLELHLHFKDKCSYTQSQSGHHQLVIFKSACNPSRGAFLHFAKWGTGNMTEVAVTVIERKIEEQGVWNLEEEMWLKGR